MTLYDLVAKISLDSTGFDAGLAGSSKKAHSFGSIVGGGFKKLAAIGVKTMAAGAAAVTAFGVTSVKSGMSFDKSMSQVAATMGISMKDMEKQVGEVDLAWGHFSGNLRDFALEMGKNTAFSASQAADALNYMALAGYNTQKSMKMLPNVLNLAAAGNMDLAEASDMVTDASSAFGLSTEQTTQMVDQMAMAASKSNTSVAQLGQAFLSVGGTAKILKGGVNEAATALGILADNGTKGSTGGIALRNILNSISGKKFEKTFGSLGISAYDADGKMRSLKDVFLDMNKAMDGMTDQEKTNLINQTFNARDLKNVNALLGTSAERWDELSGAIENSKGAAQKMADTQLDNLAGDITYFKSALEGTQIALSDKMSPALRKFVQAGTEGFSKMAESIKSGDFGGAMQIAGETVANIATGLIGYMPKVIEAGAQLILGLGKGFAKGFPDLMNSLVVAVPNLLGAFRDMFSGIDLGATFKTFGDSFKSAFDSLKGYVPMFINFGVEMIGKLGDGLVQGIPQFLQTFYPMMLSLSEFLRQNAGTMVDAGLGLITNLAQGIINALPLIIEYVPQIITNIAGIINDNAPKVLATGANIIMMLAKGIIDNIPVIVANLPQILQAIWSVFLAFNWINLGKTIVTFISNGIKTLTTTIPTALKDIASKAVEYFGAVQWSTLGADIIDLILIGIESLGQLIPQAMTALGKMAFNAFKSINWLAVGTTAVSMIVSAIKTTGKAVAIAVALMGRRGMQAFRKIDWRAVGKAAITMLVGAVKGVGKLIPNALRAAGKAAYNAFKSINWSGLGRNIITGVVRGITGAASKIASAAKQAAKNALQKAKNFLGIKSPSRVFRDQVGKNIALGLAMGISQNEKYVSSAVDGLNNAVMGVNTDDITAMSPLSAAGGSPYSTWQTVDVPDTGAGGKNVTINNYVTVDGAQNPEDWAMRFAERLRMEVRTA